VYFRNILQVADYRMKLLHVKTEHGYFRRMCKHKTELLIDASKSVDLEVHAEKTKYGVSMARHQNSRKYHNTKIGNTYFQNMTQFRYLGTTVTVRNLIQEEIKRRLNSGNACYHSLQNFLSFHLLFKNVKIRIYKTIILPVVLYGCETLSLTLYSSINLVRMIKSRRIK
jgi:hypothetical protein